MDLHFIGRRMETMLDDMAESYRVRTFHEDTAKLYNFSEKLRQGEQLTIKEFSECVNQLDYMIKQYADQSDKINEIQILLTDNTASILNIAPVADVHYKGRLVGFANSNTHGEQGKPSLKR